MEAATMAWRHPRSAQRVVIYDVDGDEEAFGAFMDRLSRQLIWSDPEAVRPALERYLDTALQITVEPRGAADGDDIYDVRPIRPVKG